MRGVVMYAPGDVRVEDRPEPIIRADRRDHPALGDLHLRLGPVALPRHRHRSASPSRWATSTSASSKRSAPRSPRSSPASSWSARSSPPTTPARSAGPATRPPASTASPSAPRAAPRPSTLRVPLADGTLVATPEVPPDDLVPGFLAASDVLGTGWFGAVAAEVGPGKTVAVVGDGAVGLLGVLAAQQLGAERIIAMSRHEPRQQLAREFGATDIVTERGDEGVARIKELTDGLGAHSRHRGGRHPGVDDAGHPLHPARRARRLRRRHPRRRPARRGAVLQPRPPARRARPRAPLPARADRPDLAPTRSTRARSSTSNCPSTKPPPATGPWTNAASAIKVLLAAR